MKYGQYKSAAPALSAGQFGEHQHLHFDDPLTKISISIGHSFGHPAPYWDWDIRSAEEDGDGGKLSGQMAEVNLLKN